MTAPTLFIATPIHSSLLHQAYVSGLLDCMSAFAGRIRIETMKGTSLSRQRDVLTTIFLQSGASHCLWVDSDIGWSAAQAQQLLDTGKDFIAGCYGVKNEACLVPAKLTGETNGVLSCAEYVPAGFLLLTRNAAERMVGAYQDRQYVSAPNGVTCGLWTTDLGDATEDVSFCRRWRAIGGECWLHTGVALVHHGEKAYVAKGIAQ